MPAHEFVLLEFYECMKAFNCQGRKYKIGEKFYWRRMGMNVRRVRALFEARWIGMPRDLSKAVMTSPQAADALKPDPAKTQGPAEPNKGAPKPAADPKPAPAPKTPSTPPAPALAIPDDPNAPTGEPAAETAPDADEPPAGEFAGATLETFPFDPATMEIQGRGNGEYYVQRDGERLFGPMTKEQAETMVANANA